MLNRIKTLIKKNTEIFALSILVLITIISTNYYNYSKKKILSEYKNLIGNIYLKKTIDNVFNNLEPKFKKIDHQISEGDTFISVLKLYSVKDKEIKEIKKKVSSKVNLNKLKAGQKIQIIIDQKKNIVKQFVFKISNTRKLRFRYRDGFR